MQRVRVRARSRHVPDLQVVPMVRTESVEARKIVEGLVPLVDEGQIASIAFAAVHYDGSITTGFAPGGRSMTLIGTMHNLERRILERFNAV